MVEHSYFAGRYRATFSLCALLGCVLFNVAYLNQIMKKLRALFKKRSYRKEVRQISTSTMMEIVRETRNYCLVDARSKKEFLTNGLKGAISAEQFNASSVKFRAMPIFFYSDYANRATEKTAKWLKEGMQAHCLEDVEPDRYRAERAAIEMDFLKNGVSNKRDDN